MLKAGVSGNRNFDVKYDIDNLNRVTKADEGTFSSGSITAGNQTLGRGIMSSVSVATHSSH